VTSPPAIYRVIVCVDMEGFGAPHRHGPQHIDMRKGLYEALERAFAASAIPADYHEDRGDGAFFLVPADGPQTRLVEPLPFELACELTRYNRSADARSRIRLRVALHAGFVQRDAEGVVGVALNAAFRLLDAPELRSALRDAPGDLAFITSDEFHRSVIRQRRGFSPSGYRRVRVAVKETDTQAWICAFESQIGVGRQYGERVALIEEALDAVEETLETARRERAATVTAISSRVPEVPDPATALRDRLARLDEKRVARRWEELIAGVAAAERDAEAALDEARSALRAVTQPLRDRDELRGRLQSYQAMAHNQQRAEDRRLDELYQRARDLLWTAPCDLVEAETATMRYVRALQEG
jgi:hypothetical protein